MRYREKKLKLNAFKSSVCKKKKKRAWLSLNIKDKMITAQETSMIKRNFTSVMEYQEETEEKDTIYPSFQVAEMQIHLEKSS